MVRAIVFISALFVAAVSAVPIPGTIDVHATDHIGLDKVHAQNVGHRLAHIDRAHLRNIIQGLNVGGEKKAGLLGLLKRGELSPVRISKIAGTKGLKTNSKNKGSHKLTAKN